MSAMSKRGTKKFYFIFFVTPPLPPGLGWIPDLQVLPTADLHLDLKVGEGLTKGKKINLFLRFPKA